MCLLLLLLQGRLLWRCLLLLLPYWGGLCADWVIKGLRGWPLLVLWLLWLLLLRLLLPPRLLLPLRPGRQRLQQMWAV